MRIRDSQRRWRRRTPPRIVDGLLEKRTRHHPAILIVGPRATGKTTTAARLARTAIRLDQPAQAAVVSADPDAALRGLDEPVLIDEWQIVPSVPRQESADKGGEKGLVGGLGPDGGAGAGG